MEYWGEGGKRPVSDSFNPGSRQVVCGGMPALARFISHKTSVVSWFGKRRGGVMVEACAAELRQSTEINGSRARRPEENFRPGLVGDVCRAIWGANADAKVAVIVGRSDRASRDYFSGRVPIPAKLLAAINVALTRRP